MMIETSECSKNHGNGGILENLSKDIIDNEGKIEVKFCKVQHTHVRSYRRQFININ